MTLNEMLENYRTLKEALASTERQIFEYCRDEMVSDYTHDGVTVTLKEEVVWDEKALDALREFFSPWEIVNYKQKPVEPKWNKVKLKQLAKSGGDPAKILAGAQSTQERFRISVKG